MAVDPVSHCWMLFGPLLASLDPGGYLQGFLTESENLRIVWF